MTTDTPELGLRERKRLATERAIQVAAIELATQRGFDGVTVDEISRIADVSPRTFFNYFPSKEAALVGELPELPGEILLEEFLHAGPGSNIIEDLGNLVANSSEHSSNDPSLMQLRRTLLKQEPRLFALRMTAMREFEEHLRLLVAERLVLDEPELASDPAALLSRSRLVTLVAFAGIRHAWACWADDDGKVTLRERIEHSFGELREMLAPSPSTGVR